MQKLKLAIIDMNDGRPNQGMRCIRSIVQQYMHVVDVKEFDTRAKCEIPDENYDIYISSGGPGDPRIGDGIWDKAYYNLIDKLWAHNSKNTMRKKYVFFICHSFQMACLHFNLASVTKRKSTSFGVQPVHKTKDGEVSDLFFGLDDPFYVVESRDYQIVQPNIHVFKEHGASILALEKIRTHVQYERAIMAVKFSEEFYGTQFHPEADPQGMIYHFGIDENKEKVIANFGQEKYLSMMEHLNDPDKIELTFNTILPRFIEMAVQHLHSRQLQPA